LKLTADMAAVRVQTPLICDELNALAKGYTTLYPNYKNNQRLTGETK